MLSALHDPVARLRGATVAAGGRARHGRRAFRRRARDPRHHGRRVLQGREGFRARDRRRARASAATTSASRPCATPRGPNYTGVEADVVVSADGEAVTVLTPAEAAYNSGGNPLTEAGIEVGPARDLFAALGDDLGQGRWSVRAPVQAADPLHLARRDPDRARRPARGAGSTLPRTRRRPALAERAAAVAP